MGKDFRLGLGNGIGDRHEIITYLLIEDMAQEDPNLKPLLINSDRYFTEYSDFYEASKIRKVTYNRFGSERGKELEKICPELKEKADKILKGQVSFKKRETGEVEDPACGLEKKVECEGKAKVEDLATQVGSLVHLGIAEDTLPIALKFKKYCSQCHEDQSGGKGVGARFGILPLHDPQLLRTFRRKPSSKTVLESIINSQMPPPGKLKDPQYKDWEKEKNRF